MMGHSLYFDRATYTTDLFWYFWSEIWIIAILTHPCSWNVGPENGFFICFGSKLRNIHHDWLIIAKYFDEKSHKLWICWLAKLTILFWFIFISRQLGISFSILLSALQKLILAWTVNLRLFQFYCALASMIQNKPAIILWLVQ